MEKITDTGRLPLLVDSRELTRTGRTLEGMFELVRLPRLASLLSRIEGALAWRAAGARQPRPDGGFDEFLHLRIDGEAAMQCVRCLADTTVPIRVERSFRLAESEERAAREDADDSEFDVIAGGARFDLGELIEDEAIMALPPIARHEHCELPGGLAAGPGEGLAAEPAEDRVRPFAGLAALKKREE